MVATTLVAYWPALSALTLWIDDDEYLVRNPLVQQPSLASAWEFLGRPITPSTVRGYYQPLTMISLMLDYAMGGRSDNLRPFHRTSLLLHAVNSAMVAILLYQLFGHIGAAAFVGVLFGAHPTIADTLPWVSERKTLLAAFFALASLNFHVRYARHGGRGMYAMVVMTYTLALMSKPTSTPLPVLMLLLDFWPLQRLGKRALIEKVPLFAMGGLFGMITVLSQGHYWGIELPSERARPQAVLISCHNIVFYLGKILWPVNLSSHTPFPVPFDLSHPAVLTGVVGTCAIVVALLVSLRWTRALLVGWLYFFLAISPTLGIIGYKYGYSMIAWNKYVYLPLVGLLLPLTYFLICVWDAFSARGNPTAVRIPTVLLMVLVVVAEVRTTRGYLACWQDAERLARHELTVSPESPDLHDHLGNILVERGDLDGAIEHYNQAIRHWRGYPRTLLNLAGALARKGLFEQAMQHYQEALKVDPHMPEAHYNLGNLLVKLGNTDEAITHFTEAVRLRPTFVDAHVNLGGVLFKQGKMDEAIAHYTEAVRLAPASDFARKNLATAMAARARLNAAGRE